MFEILWWVRILFLFFACILRYLVCPRHSNVLHSETVNLDEYYLKNDLLNYMVTITYEENNPKYVDPLLLFQLELNTHSTSVSVYLPTHLRDNTHTPIIIIANFFQERVRDFISKKHMVHLPYPKFNSDA